MENTVSDNTVGRLAKDTGPKVDTTRFHKIPVTFLDSPGGRVKQKVEGSLLMPYRTVTAQDFYTELTRLLNSKCQENASNTPDFILANFMLASLEAFNAAVRERERWYGRKTF